MLIAQKWRFSMKKSEKILIALGIIQVIISILQLISLVLGVNPIILFSFFHYLNLHIYKNISTTTICCGFG